MTNKLDVLDLIDGPGRCFNETVLSSDESPRGCKWVLSHIKRQIVSKFMRFTILKENFSNIHDEEN